ncbi:MAG: PcfJ domain-containing protein [Saprospiraceae bacterium]
MRLKTASQSILIHRNGFDESATSYAMLFTIFKVSCYLYLIGYACHNKWTKYKIKQNQQSATLSTTIQQKDEKALREKQIAWQIEIVEALYKNNFQPIRYFFPFKKTVEESILQFYHFLPGEEAWKRDFCYHFLGKIAAHSLQLQYLKDWITHGTINGLFQSIVYWQQRGKMICRIEDWRIEQDNQTLYDYTMQAVGFLFAKYSVPLFIMRIWASWNQQYVVDFCNKNQKMGSIATTELPENVLFDLFFYLGNGGSLRKSPYLNWHFSKKAAHIFCNKGNHHSHWNNVYWESVAEAEGIKADYLDAFDTMFFYMEPTAFHFWRVLFQQIAQLSKEECVDLDLVGAIDLAMVIKFGYSRYEEKTPTFANHEPDFEWSTRKLKHSVAYLLRRYTVQYPAPQDLEDSYTIVTKMGECWHFTLLRNRHELFVEGRAMQHCVGEGDYHHDASNGHCSYWSLQKRNEQGEAQRKLTLEVYDIDKTLITALGYDNRDAKAEELAVLKRWCELINVKIDAAELVDQD